MKNTKTILTSLATSFCLLLTACGAAHDEAWYEKHDPKKLAKEESEEIFEYLMNEDIESLCELFSDDVKGSHDLEAEWKDFFDHIDGNIVSYDGLSFPGEGLSIDKDGVVYDSHLNIRFNNVATDTDKTYPAIGYYQTRINTAHPISEGINVFSLKKKDEGVIVDDIVVGDLIVY